jgi:hypothetical protein
MRSAKGILPSMSGASLINSSNNTDVSFFRLLIAIHFQPQGGEANAYLRFKCVVYQYGPAVFSVKASINQILRHKKAIAAVWVLLILFPNPLVLLIDVYRFFEMPTKPTDDMQLVAASLPANGSAIEQYVDAHVHYTYDFQAYGVVWYLPTPSDVLKSQQGDCKSRAILTASLL